MNRYGYFSGGTVTLARVLQARDHTTFSHEPDKDFEHADHALQKSSKVIAKLQKKYAKSRAKTIRRFAPDLTETSRNYAESNNRIIELKTLMRQPLDEQDEFILDTLDVLASEAEENEDVQNSEAIVTWRLTRAIKVNQPSN